MSLRKKAISGLLWTFGQQAGVQVINFVIQIFLARLLMPEAFGLIAMLQVFIAVSNSLADNGMTSSLIRTKDPNNYDYSTVFFINIAVSIFLYLILFLGSPQIALFYDQPELDLIVKVYSLVIVIQAFNAVQTTKLTKEMNFKLQMMMQIPSVLIGGLVGIVMAIKGYGVWSLVWMQITNTFLFTSQHWIFTKWRPKLHIDREKLKHHFSFGYKLTLSGLLSTIYYNVYRIVIGKFYSATQLGFYHQANALSMFPVNNLNKALAKVTYPVFSTLQDDTKRLRQVYIDIGKYVFWGLCPTVVFLIVFAEPIFILVLTDKWLPSVPYFQILAFATIFYPHSFYSMNILAAKGRTDLHLRIEVYKRVIGILTLFALMRFGVIGIVTASSVGMLISTFFNSYYCARFIEFSVYNQFKQLIPFLIVSSVYCLVVFFLPYRYLKNEMDSDLIILLLMALIFFAGYFLLTFLCNLVKIDKLLQIFALVKN